VPGRNNIPAALHFKTIHQLLVLNFLNVVYAFTIGSPDRQTADDNRSTEAVS